MSKPREVLERMAQAFHTEHDQYLEEIEADIDGVYQGHVAHRRNLQAALKELVEETITKHHLDRQYHTNALLLAITELKL